MDKNGKHVELLRTVRTGKKIEFYFSSNLDFFIKNSFYVEYEREEWDAPESIQNVTFAMVMAPICWAVGADLLLPCLDAEALRSLQRCREYFLHWKPKGWSFEGEIKTKVVVNKCDPQRCGLLFSGGLDSLTSFISHQEDKPELYIIFGGDIPLLDLEYIAECKKEFSRFAKEQGVRINFIYTDIYLCVSLKKLRCFAANWFSEISHSMLYTGLTAALTYEGIKTLCFASSHGVDESLWGSAQALDDQIAWGQTKVVHDLAGVERIFKIKQFFKAYPQLHSYLHVCWDRTIGHNCGKCEKCLRTIVGLLIYNIDPARCNFIIDQNTLPALKTKMRSYMGRHKLFYGGNQQADRWYPMRNEVNLQELQDIYGSREFLQWFKESAEWARPLNPFLLKFLAYRYQLKIFLLGLLKIK